MTSVVVDDDNEYEEEFESGEEEEEEEDKMIVINDKKEDENNRDSEVVNLPFIINNSQHEYADNNFQSKLRCLKKKIEKKRIDNTPNSSPVKGDCNDDITYNDNKSIQNKNIKPNKPLIENKKSNKSPRSNHINTTTSNNNNNEQLESIDRTKQQFHANNTPITKNSRSNISYNRYKKVNKNQISVSTSKLNQISRSSNIIDTLSNNIDNDDEINKNKKENINIDINFNTIENENICPINNEINIIDDKIKDNISTVATLISETPIPISYVNVDITNTNIEGIIESKEGIDISPSINDIKIILIKNNEDHIKEANDKNLENMKLVKDKIDVILDTDISSNDSNDVILINLIDTKEVIKEINHENSSNNGEKENIEPIEPFKSYTKSDGIININHSNENENTSDKITEELIIVKKISAITIKSDVNKFMSELEPPPQEVSIVDEKNNTNLSHRNLISKSNQKFDSKNIGNKNISEVNNVVKINPRSQSKLIPSTDVYVVKKASLIDNKKSHNNNNNNKSKVEFNKKKPNNVDKIVISDLIKRNNIKSVYEIKGENKITNLTNNNNNNNNNNKELNNKKLINKKKYVNKKKGKELLFVGSNELIIDDNDKDKDDDIEEISKTASNINNDIDNFQDENKAQVDNDDNRGIIHVDQVMIPIDDVAILTTDNLIRNSPHPIIATVIRKQALNIEIIINSDDNKSKSNNVDSDIEIFNKDVVIEEENKKMICNNIKQVESDILGGDNDGLEQDLNEIDKNDDERGIINKTAIISFQDIIPNEIIENKLLIAKEIIDEDDINNDITKFEEINNDTNNDVSSIKHLHIYDEIESKSIIK